ncbi:hypothetical protein K0M31_004210 [Melipona bicolor]|uniref:Uncharacterized protein n=1 Tax=Melipona bicolor TaxID=60889 RepID=A0AA40FWY6_9HYME|nr:hypothetical protein K0M31_004210 [Melipona bicolor]
MRSAGIFLILIYCISLRLVFVHGGMDVDEIRAMLTKFRKKCIDETNANLEMIENTDFGEFPEDESLKCYFKCVFEKFHMVKFDRWRFAFNPYAASSIYTYIKEYCRFARII